MLAQFAIVALCIALATGQPTRATVIRAQSGTQTLTTTLTTRLTVTDGYDTKTHKLLSEEGKVHYLQFDDGDRWETEADHFTAYQFSKATNALPPNANIQSVKIAVEHHEEDGFANGALRWEAGIGDLYNPIPLTSHAPTILRGENAEAYVEWDITTWFTSSVLLNNLKFVVQNNARNGRKSKTDYLFVVITYTFNVTATPTSTATPTVTPTSLQSASATPTFTATPSLTAPTPTQTPPGPLPLIKFHLPAIVNDAVLTPSNNHTACTASAITPPATVIQAADNAFNIYRFVAGAESYAVSLNNYASSGLLLFYLITEDRCPRAGTLSLSFVGSKPITSATTQAIFMNLTPGERYMLAVNTTGALTSEAYIIAITP